MTYTRALLGLELGMSDLHQLPGYTGRLPASGALEACSVLLVEACSVLLVEPWSVLLVEPWSILLVEAWAPSMDLVYFWATWAESNLPHSTRESARARVSAVSSV